MHTWQYMILEYSLNYYFETYWDNYFVNKIRKFIQ